MNVLVTIINQGWVHKSVVEAVQQLILADPAPKTIMYPAVAPPYYNALNQIAKMVREGDWDYWLSIDDDNAPTRNPLELMELDKDYLGLPTPMWKPQAQEPLQWNVYRDGKPLTDGRGLMEVDLVGSGCFLASRRVFQHDNLKNPFFPGYTMDGIRTTGPDTAFCLRLRHSGFGVWAHFDYPCNHVKEVNLLDLAEAKKPEPVVV